MTTKKIVTLLLLVGLFVACNKKSKENNQVLKTADSFFYKKEYEQAKVYYLQALKHKPLDASLINKIAKIDSIVVMKDKEVQYHNTIKIADNHFDNKNYVAAKKAYIKASKIKPNDVYAKERIADVDYLLPLEVQSTKSFHIIVGSFKVKSNAIKMQEKLISKGFNSNIIPRFNGVFNAVSYSSHINIHDAYNNLKEPRNKVHAGSWVLYHVVDTEQ